MVLTVYSVLSPVTGLVCHRRLRGKTPRENLTPASGRQDHTASPFAKTSFVCAQKGAPDAFASTASRPTVVTTRDRPSLGTGCFGYRGDLHFGKTEIFSARGLDRPNQLEMAQQIRLFRAVIFVPQAGPNAMLLGARCGGAASNRRWPHRPCGPPRAVPIARSPAWRRIKPLTAKMNSRPRTSRGMQRPLRF